MEYDTSLSTKGAVDVIGPVSFLSFIVCLIPLWGYVMCNRCFKRKLSADRVPVSLSVMNYHLCCNGWSQTASRLR